MATAFRTIGHEDRLSIVEHLDELRSRLLICVAALVLAFCLCFWQNHALLRAINKPLSTTTEQRTKDGKGPIGDIYVAQNGTLTALQTSAAFFKVVAADTTVSPATRLAATRQFRVLRAQLKTFPTKPPANVPITIGVGEPFFATITIALYFSLLISAPIILWQLYSFLLPALSPTERRIATPLMSMIPLLFGIGAVFGYLVVLPAATSFLQNFNSDQFNVLVQAKDYYKFAALILLAMGLVFQLPVAILALTRLGVLNVRILRKNRRYAILVLTVIAAALPGVDPVSMLIELVPLLLLYEISILMARFFGGAEREVSRFAWLDSDEDDDDEDDEDLDPDDDPDRSKQDALP